MAKPGYLRSSILFLLTLHAVEAPTIEHCYCMNDCSHTTEYEVTLRGEVILDDLLFDGRPVHEFSGLAWDEEHHILYAVSDQGILARMRPRFEKQQPGKTSTPEYHVQHEQREQQVERLVGVETLGAVILQDKYGIPLKGPYRDSEGLALATDGTLLISFERQPRICAHRLNGYQASCWNLSENLQDPRNYQGANLSLEAVTILPGGKALTGPEAPLEGAGNTRQLHLYEAEGHEPTAPRIITAYHPGGLLVGLATLPGGRLLVLERSRTLSPINTPIAVHVYYPWCSDHQNSFLLLAIGGKQLKSRETPRQWPAPGHWPMANFEGIAVRDANHFFLVSDDNDPLPGRASLLYVEWTESNPGM